MANIKIMPLPSILKNRRKYVSIIKLKNKLIKKQQATSNKLQASSNKQSLSKTLPPPSGGGKSLLNLTGMGFYGITIYDFGLPTMPRQTILENTRATRPWHIGAHETLSRWRIAPVPKKKEHEAKRTTIRSCLFSIKKLKAKSLKLQANQKATSYKQSLYKNPPPTLGRGEIFTKPPPPTGGGKPTLGRGEIIR